jgi:putative PIN family toxin of toxin-antitoxin system
VRVVLDPNVHVSALLAPSGTPAQLILRWFAGDFELVVSEKVLEELERVLGYPKIRSRIAREDAAEFVTLLRDTAVVVTDPPDPRPRSEDAGDDYLLALAESAEALLVSGDQHLLALANRFPVLTPRELVGTLEPPA